MPGDREINFDGLVGPTHFFGGLAQGNLASMESRGAESNPRAAVLEGLAKMKLLASLGVGQAVFPPHPRPWWPMIRAAGFEDLQSCFEQAPDLLRTSYSAASMWSANAATVSPASDCADGKTHFTPANLSSNPHRAIEAEVTTAVLRFLFSDHERFVAHDPLPAHWRDEGAANHLRLCNEVGEAGVELFVFGIDGKSFKARQSREACEAIIQQHKLDPARVVLAQQSGAAIDAGVFHCDVIAVSHRQTLLMHKIAFENSAQVLDELRTKFLGATGSELNLIEITDDELTLEETVRTYLFNSQLIDARNGLTLIAPKECETHAGAQRAIAKVRAGGIADVKYAEVRQSMRNGGGPSCLRLRVVMRDEDSIRGRVLWSEELHQELVELVTRRYREKLTWNDLANEEFARESWETARQIWQTLGMDDVFYGIAQSASPCRRK